MTYVSTLQSLALGSQSSGPEAYTQARHPGHENKQSTGESEPEQLLSSVLDPELASSPEDPQLKMKRHFK